MFAFPESYAHANRFRIKAPQNAFCGVAEIAAYFLK